MRQRAKRELVVLGGVAVIIAAVAVFKYSFELEGEVEKYDSIRRSFEAAREGEGMEILKWRHMRATAGNLRSGPTFTEELKAYADKQVNLIGFIVPENKFRDVDEFILLPLPIECYFCKRPPVHDVMAIQMVPGTTTKIFEDAVLVNGVLRLHEGENQKYFYSIEHAAVESAAKGVEMRSREIDPRHMLPKHNEAPVLDKGFDVEKLGN